MGLIVEKQLKKPKFRARTVRKERMTPYQGEGAVVSHLLHFRPENGALVCGEGKEEVAQIIKGADLYRASGRTFFYKGEFLYEHVAGGVRLIDRIRALKTIVSTFDEEGNETPYAVCEEQIFSIGELSVKEVSSSRGGVCAAWHYDRLFTARGYRLYYSAPMRANETEETLHGAGYVDLPEVGGDVFGLIPFKEKLYLFRERCVTQLRVQGDVRNVKAINLPTAFGRIYRRTVANCGEKILFVTENGLYSFGGAYCTRVEGSGISEISVDEETNAAFCGSRYYLAGKNKRGERALLSVSVADGSGYLIGERARSVAAIEGEAYFTTDEGKLFRLTPFGLPTSGECIAEIGRTALGLSARRKYLDALLLEGHGYFRIIAEGEKDSVTVCGKAGETLYFPKPVRGTAFRLRICTCDADCALRAITFSVREESAYGY